MSFKYTVERNKLISTFRGLCLTKVCFSESDIDKKITSVKEKEEYEISPPAAIGLILNIFSI